MKRASTYSVIAAAVALATMPFSAQAQKWTKIKHKPSFTAGAALLLTDGTVMVQDQNNDGSAGNDWWRLTPDSSGSYVNGTWSQLASMPAGYQPLFFASAVLQDGRVIVQGGEYNAGNGVRTTKGALYDPAADSWVSVAPPKGWTTIGDAQTTLLKDGTYMVANCTTMQAATLNPSTLAFTAIGTGKDDSNDEEGWTLLPSGQVLTADANNTADPKHTEIMSTKGKWTSAGDSPVLLADIGTGSQNSHEIGPQVLRPDGTVFVGGATGFTAIYDTKTSKWTQGPTFPKSGNSYIDQADAPGALLPNGNVLLAASPGIYNGPTTFYEFDGTNLNPVPAVPNAGGEPSFVVRLTVLPSGEIMQTDGTMDVEFYSSSGSPNQAWLPVVKNFPTQVSGGTSYTLKGKYLAGFSQGASFGDDLQTSTNYPIVEIVNTASGHVQFAKTTGLTSYLPANPLTVSTSVTIPAGIEKGASTLTVVTNGIPSSPFKITVK